MNGRMVPTVQCTKTLLQFILHSSKRSAKRTASGLADHAGGQRRRVGRFFCPPCTCKPQNAFSPALRIFLWARKTCPPTGTPDRICGSMRQNRPERSKNKAQCKNTRMSMHFTAKKARIRQNGTWLAKSDRLPRRYCQTIAQRRYI